MIDLFRRASWQTRGVSVILALLWASPIAAQQQPPQAHSTQSAPAAPAAPSAPAEQAPSPAPATAGTKNTDGPPPVQQKEATPQNDRLFFALPNFQTVENIKQLPPLTAGEKFKLVAEGNFDRAEYPWVATQALIGQLGHDEASFGQGFRGYAKRYAVAFGDTTVGNFTTGAVVPSMLHQDPRYYQLGTGGFFHRTAYAFKRVFVIRGDSGRNQFNASEIFGNAMAGGISELYHPKGDRTLTNVVGVWYTQTAWDLVGFELKEFWPDLHRLIKKQRSPTP